METKIIRINPKQIKLLEVNARFMKAEEFRKLVDNVKRDGCLTQLPFCCKNAKGELVVLSGNHRVQAAIEAGLKEIEVQMTEDKLSKDQMTAIQLSHNAISGQDDMAILKQLYESIDDIEFKAYSALDDETLELLSKIQSQSMSGEGLKYQILNLLFLPSEMKEIGKCLKQCKQELKGNKTLLARYEDYDKYLDLQVDVSKASDIKNTAVVFMSMLEIIKNHIGDLKTVWLNEGRDKQYVPISTILGRSDMKVQDARVLNKAIDLLVSQKKIKKGEKEKGLVYLASYFLDGKKGS